MTDISLPPKVPDRRIMAIWLPRLAIDRWRQAEAPAAQAEPTVLLAETAHGPRIAAANDAALAAGAMPQMRLADARALAPMLKAAPSDPADWGPSASRMLRAFMSTTPTPYEAAAVWWKSAVPVDSCSPRLASRAMRADRSALVVVLTSQMLS